MISGDVCRHHYSKDQAWNADQTVIWLNKGCDKFIDGNTYVFLPNLKSPPDKGGEITLASHRAKRNDLRQKRYIGKVESLHWRQ